MYFCLPSTHTSMQKTFFPPDCFPIFLAERFMVRGMLETGYYHVPFELISQTKWSRWKRQRSQAFTGAHSLLLASPPALAHVNPAPVAAHSPTLPCFSSALGSRAVHTVHASSFSPHTFSAGVLDVKHSLPCTELGSLWWYSKCTVRSLLLALRLFYIFFNDFPLFGTCCTRVIF